MLRNAIAPSYKNMFSFFSGALRKESGQKKVFTKRASTDQFEMTVVGERLYKGSGNYFSYFFPNRNVAFLFYCM